MTNNCFVKHSLSSAAVFSIIILIFLSSEQVEASLGTLPRDFRLPFFSWTKIPWILLIQILLNICAIYFYFAKIFDFVLGIKSINQSINPLYWSWASFANASVLRLQQAWVFMCEFPTIWNSSTKHINICTVRVLKHYRPHLIIIIIWTRCRLRQ